LKSNANPNSALSLACNCTPYSNPDANRIEIGENKCFNLTLQNANKYILAV